MTTTWLDDWSDRLAECEARLGRAERRGDDRSAADMRAAIASLYQERELVAVHAEHARN